MRTALALLFLLALAAVPGALLPQRSLNEFKTEQYIADHGFIGEFLDKIQMYEVFSSIWFTAIYVLLFISLVGCLTPRMIEHAKALRARPVPAPRNLGRLPRHESHEVDGTPDEIASKINSGLRGWRKTTRTVERKEADGSVVTVVEVSAEKGYLREGGNLLFHFALLALLVAIAAGKMFGYEGTRILVADGQEGLCNTSTAVYDSFRAGNLVDGTNLNEFCLQVESFDADFLPSGQPEMYSADLKYQVGSDIDSDAVEDQRRSRVNHPLRIAGDRIYLLGNGFAPTFTVTFPNGETRTQTVPFRPDELQTMMSSGVARFDTPAGLYPNEDERRKNQIAIEGLFAPTATFHGGLMTSSFPLPEAPGGRHRHLQGRHRPRHRTTAERLHPRCEPDQPGTSAQAGTRQPQHGRIDHPRGRHDRAVRRLSSAGCRCRSRTIPPRTGCSCPRSRCSSDCWCRC